MHAGLSQLKFIPTSRAEDLHLPMCLDRSGLSMHLGKMCAGKFCVEQMMAKDLRQHEEEECDLRLVECMHCGVEVIACTHHYAGERKQTNTEINKQISKYINK